MTRDDQIARLFARLYAGGANEQQIREWAVANHVDPSSFLASHTFPKGLNLPAVIPATTGAESAASAAANTAAKSGGFWSNLKDPNKPLFGGKMGLPKLNNIRSFLQTKPVWTGGPSIAKAGTAVMGVTQGAKALKGLYENSKAEQDLDSLKNDISLQIASNPMYDMYLDASDEKTLRQMENGNLTNNWGGALEGGIKGIPQAAISALMGSMLGPAGALVGGLGSLVNSSIKGYGQDTQEAQAKLQGLYGKLRQANEEYRTMKRPSNLRTSGLQTRYFNQLY